MELWFCERARNPNEGVAIFVAALRAFLTAMRNDVAEARTPNRAISPMH